IRPISVRRSLGLACLSWAGGPGPELTLALLVAGVVADHIDLAPAADDLAVFANPLDAGSDLHRTLFPSSSRGRARWRPGPPVTPSSPRSGPRRRIGPIYPPPGDPARSESRQPSADQSSR